MKRLKIIATIFLTLLITAVISLPITGFIKNEETRAIIIKIALPTIVILIVPTTIVREKISIEKEKEERERQEEQLEEQLIQELQKTTAQEKQKIYKQKKYLTEAEKEFYDKLLRATYDMDVQVIPQIPLSSVVEKTVGRYQNELYRVIDYGIFDLNNNLLLLIELNDRTHFQADRQIRDFKVANICKEAGIKLITFWTNFDNEQEYIRTRIQKTINNEAAETA